MSAAVEELQQLPSHFASPPRTCGELIAQRKASYHQSVVEVWSERTEHVLQSKEETIRRAINSASMSTVFRSPMALQETERQRVYRQQKESSKRFVATSGSVEAATATATGAASTSPKRSGASTILTTAAAVSSISSNTGTRVVEPLAVEKEDRRVVGFSAAAVQRSRRQHEADNANGDPTAKNGFSFQEPVTDSISRRIFKHATTVSSSEGGSSSSHGGGKQRIVVPTPLFTPQLRHAVVGAVYGGGGTLSKAAIAHANYFAPPNACSAGMPREGSTKQGKKHLEAATVAAAAEGHQKSSPRQKKVIVSNHQQEAAGFDPRASRCNGHARPASALDRFDVPMFSSFAKDGVFRPDSARLRISDEAVVLRGATRMSSSTASATDGQRPADLVSYCQSLVEVHVPSAPPPDSEGRRRCAPQRPLSAPSARARFSSTPSGSLHLHAVDAQEGIGVFLSAHHHHQPAPPRVEPSHAGASTSPPAPLGVSALQLCSDSARRHSVTMLSDLSHRQKHKAQTERGQHDDDDDDDAIGVDDGDDGDDGVFAASSTTATKRATAQVVLREPFRMHFPATTTISGGAATRTAGAASSSSRSYRRASTAFMSSNGNGSGAVGDGDFMSSMSTTTFGTTTVESLSHHDPLCE